MYRGPSCENVRAGEGDGVRAGDMIWGTDGSGAWAAAGGVSEIWVAPAPGVGGGATGCGAGAGGSTTGGGGSMTGGGGSMTGGGSSTAGGGGSPGAPRAPKPCAGVTSAEAEAGSAAAGPDAAGSHGGGSGAAGSEAAGSDDPKLGIDTILVPPPAGYGSGSCSGSAA